MKTTNGKKMQFNTTAKLGEKHSKKESIRLIIPHLLLITLTLIGMLYNTVLLINNTHPSYSAFIANTIWASYNIYQINPIIRAAFK